MVKKRTFKKGFLRKCFPGAAHRSNSHGVRGSKGTAWTKALRWEENRCREASTETNEGGGPGRAAGVNR